MKWVDIVKFPGQNGEHNNTTKVCAKVCVELKIVSTGINCTVKYVMIFSLTRSFLLFFNFCSDAYVALPFIRFHRIMFIPPINIRISLLKISTKSSNSIKSIIGKKPLHT